MWYHRRIAHDRRARHQVFLVALTSGTENSRYVVGTLWHSMDTKTKKTTLQHPFPRPVLLGRIHFNPHNPHHHSVSYHLLHLLYED